MQIPFSISKCLIPILGLFICVLRAQGQPITGVWKGRMGSSRIELKLIRKGDSLIGTSYYYESKSNYRRYSVKGYFENGSNDVVWWDDVLIEDQSAHHIPGINGKPVALLASADFNCPGEGVMKLDGRSSRKDDDQKDKKDLHLVKGDDQPVFPDEWDFLIENYAFGVNHPEVVDSIEQLAFNPQPTPAAEVSTPDPSIAVIEKPIDTNGSESKNSSIKAQNAVVTTGQFTTVEEKPKAHIPPAEQTNQQRFASTEKILQNVIPIKGDSIEFRFYDNAEIDGDSIAVFLNGHLLREHILLAETAYIMKIAVKDLQPDNELVMVAENLGTIPPNTSLMVAIVEDKRYEAHLESTMGSSALVRLVKP
jgi:hypothetical protein